MNLSSPELWTILHQVSNCVTCNYELIIKKIFYWPFHWHFGTAYRPKLLQTTPFRKLVLFQVREKSKSPYSLGFYGRASPKPKTLQFEKAWSMNSIQNITPSSESFRLSYRSLVSTKWKKPHSPNVCNKPNITWWNCELTKNCWL